MNFARAISSFAILACFSIYVYLNTITVEGSHGYEFLFLISAIFGVLLVISGNLANFLMWRFSTVLLATFFIYFAANLYLDTDDTWQVGNLLFGTSGGIFLAFLLGFVLSQALSAIYDLRNDTKSNVVLYLMTTIYALLVLGLAILVFIEHRGDRTGDVFLVDEVVGYQRVGDFFIMQFMALASLVCVIAVTSRRKGIRLVLVPTSLLMAVCGVYAFTSQLLGSNKGFVVPVGILFVYLAVIFAGSSSRQRIRRTSILNILLSGMVFKLLFASLVALAVLAILGQTLLQMLGIEAGALRITGYGTGEIVSVTSRGELFSDNFLTHFMYSPIFGNTQVHLLTTGEGTFVHSTLSILTHLGVVGFLMYLGVVILTYLEISYSFTARHSSIFGDQNYSLFRLLCLFTVTTMGLFSEFFTWMPLWFSLGIFGNWYHQSRVRSQLINRGRDSAKRRQHRRSRFVPGHK